MPVNIGAGYSTLLVTAPYPKIQRGIFNCGMHGNVGFKLSPRENFHSQHFNLRHFHKSVSNVVNYGLWRKMRYQNVDEKISKTSVSLCYYTLTRFENLKLRLLIQVWTFFLFLRCLFINRLFIYILIGKLNFCLFSAFLVYSLLCLLHAAIHFHYVPSSHLASVFSILRFSKP